MWQRKSASTLQAEVDSNNSWSADSLIPSDTIELELESLAPRNLPIRVSKLTAKVTGFLFPEANQWVPPKPVGEVAEKPKRKKKLAKDGEKSRRHRFKPPTDVVKLQDRLYLSLIHI